MKRTQLILISCLIALLLIVSPMIVRGAPTTILIDFEGIPAGTIVDQLYPGFGINGGEGIITGYVEVFGYNPDIDGDINTAMIFDAACLPLGTPAGCTGGDPDLFKPQLGNVMILSEDLDTTDPDDADVPESYYLFDFRNLGGGVVSVDNFYVLDVEDEEDGAVAEFYSGGPDGTLLASVNIPNVGNNGLAVVPVNITGIDYARITLNGSGAIDGFQIQVEPADTPTPTASQTLPPGITPSATSTPTSTATPTLTPTVPIPPAITFTSTPTATITLTPSPTEPNAVKLKYFRIDDVTGQEVDLSWETASEVDHYAFELYRAEGNNRDEAELITTVPGSADGAFGKHYDYTDTVPFSGDWWYWLVDVDTQGVETEHGPVNTGSFVGGAPVFDVKIFVPLLQIGN